MHRFAAVISSILFFLPVSAHARIKSLDTHLPPPDALYEVNPGERPDYLLSPGYWIWNGKNHVWQHSRWIEKREGYLWVPDQWQRRGDKWHLLVGHWVEDEDYEVAEPEIEAIEKPALQVAPSAAQKKPVAKKNTAKNRVRKINYRDPVLWPSPRRR